jgi:hypothetical protein
MLLAMLCAFTALLTTAPPAMAQAMSEPTGRYGGEAQIASQPPLPVHFEIRPSDSGFEGAISMPVGDFVWRGKPEGNAISGPFEGAGGAGDLTVMIDGDALSGTFTLGEASGTITATRTALDAQGFFKPPEQRLNLSTSQWLEDLDRLAEILIEEHGSPFEHTSRQQLDSEIARVRAAIASLDGVAVALEFRKLGALIGDGHTEVALPAGRPLLPIELFWFEDGLRVTGASAAHQHLLGARLRAIAGVPAEGIVERLRPFIAPGETEWFVRAALPELVANPDVLRAAISAGPSFAFSFESDGVDEEVQLAASTAETEAWARLGDAAPLWQQNDSQAFWSKRLDNGSVYVNWRSYDRLAEASEALLQQLDADHPRRLIIDLRDNTGGDFTVGRAFVAAIASRPHLNREGVLHVLIGRKTFSAAMTNAVDFKTMTKATLVGEPAGAAPNNWQEVRRFNLPNSGLMVGVSTLHYAFLPGETELRSDIQLGPEPRDWGAPHDAAVELILSRP